MNPDASEKLALVKTSVPSPWRLSLGLIAALIVSVAVAFHRDVWQTLQIWYYYPAYSHCFLILPISAWLVWEKRAQLLAETPVPEPRALPLALVMAFVWLIGYYSTTTEIRQIAIVGLLEVILLAVLGWRIYRLILFPALFLFFLVPTGEYLIPPLQRLTADFTDAGLTFFGVVHYREGTVFELVNGRYGVAEACAGLRFLTATFTLGTLFCYLSFRRWWKIVAFLVASIVLPIGANAIRVLATIMVANYTDNRVAAGMDHIVYGWGFAVLIMLALLYVGSLFRDPFVPGEDVIKPKQKMQPGIAAPLAVAAILVGAIAIGPAFAMRETQRIAPPDLASLAEPLKLHGWTVAPLTGPWAPTFVAQSAEFKGTLWAPEMGASSVDLVVEDFTNTARSGSLVAMKNHLWDGNTWTETSSETMHAKIGAEPATFTESIISSFFGERLVWSCYWVDGETATSPTMVKWLQLRRIFGARDEAAAIVLSTPVEGSIVDSQKRLMTVLAAAGDPILHRLSPAPQKSQE